MNIYAKLIARQKARECAVQALYSWQLSEDINSNIKLELIEEVGMSEIDITYFNEIYIGVISNYKKIDNLLSSYISRKIEKIDYIEKAILRIAVFELIKNEIPYKVVINEAIERAKKFGSNGSHKFINGVLDKLAYVIKRRKLFIK